MHDIPLIAFDALDERLQEQLRARVERLGYLGEFFRIFAHQPDSLLAFNTLTEALKQALPDRMTEVVALTVATCTRNAYERNQHIRLCRKLGLTDAWIRQVIALDPAAGTDLTVQDRAIQTFVLSALADFGRGSLEDFHQLKAACGTEPAVALVMLVGRYVSHAIAVNCFALQPPVTNPLEEEAQ